MIMEEVPYKDKLFRDALLVQATELAVSKRREKLREERHEIADAYAGETRADHSVYIMTYEHLQRMIDIKKELSIIDALMISTQREFKKMGGKVSIEIRHSDEPNKIQNSFSI